jgi:hemimethylated DNA binding protein
MALVPSLYRNLRRGARLLEQQIALHPELSVSQEASRFLLPLPLESKQLKGRSLAEITRQQFDAHKNYSSSDDVDSLIDLAFRAIRQTDERINVLQTDWKPKDSKVVYGCGDCVTHRKFGYRGVVIGWDAKCMASDQWIKLMGVDDLADGIEQPFYSVLVDVRDRTDAQTTYVAQENMELLQASAGPIHHPEVEDFLASYLPEEGRYIITEQLRVAFPED